MREHFDHVAGPAPVRGLGRDSNHLLGSALLDLKIRDLPVRYRDRTYGTTNISRFAHGWLLLRITWFALWRVKFRL